MTKENERTVHLTQAQLVVLAIYFVFLILGGIFFVVTDLSKPPSNLELRACIGMAVIGGAVYYSRKIYKGLLGENIEVSSDPTLSNKRFGTFLYFILRPIFGCGFALLAYAIVKGSLVASVKGSFETADSFVYLLMVAGFLSGFLAGKVLSELEELKVSKLLGNGGS